MVTEVGYYVVFTKFVQVIPPPPRIPPISFGRNIKFDESSFNSWENQLVIMFLTGGKGSP